MLPILGLTPQSVGVLGGYKVQGKRCRSCKKLIEDAKKCEEAGAIAIVLECVPYQLAKIVTDSCLFQPLELAQEMTQMDKFLFIMIFSRYGVDRVAKFVKQYANVDAINESSVLKVM